MSTGTIKKVVSERGFGFIEAVDGKERFLPPQWDGRLRQL